MFDKMMQLLALDALLLELEGEDVYDKQGTTEGRTQEA